jgi:hypothetical protein
MSTVTKKTDRKRLLERYVKHIERKTLTKIDLRLLKVLGFREAYEIFANEMTKKEVEQKER